MMLLGMTILATAIAAVVSFVALGVVVLGVLRIVSRKGGLAALAKHYPAAAEPEGQRLVRQTAKIGAVQYRNCVTITVTPAGLWLHVFNLVSAAPAVLIPWDAIVDVRQTRLDWRKAARLSVGRPEVSSITVYWDVYLTIRSQAAVPVG